MSDGGNKRLGEILGARGYVTEARIAQLLTRADHAGKKLGEILVEEKYITRDVLDSALEEQRSRRQK